MTTHHGDPGHDGDLGVELTVAREAADEAAAIVRASYLRPTRRRRKGAHDVVTAIDVRAERAIMHRLRSAFPCDARIGEESGASGGRTDGAHGRSWLVDPLDGTVNFAAGVPFFSVSIALVERGRALIGIVVDPLTEERFVGVTGSGAWHEPSLAALAARRLPSAADAVVSADPGDADDAEAAARIGRLRRRVRAIRTFGSTALSLAYLAAGRLDGVLQVNGLQSVDVAAGALVATLAGARVTAADGRPLLRSDALTDDAGIAAGRPAVHRLLVRR